MLSGGDSMTISTLQKKLLEDCTNDDMGLWVVVWHITKAHTTTDNLQSEQHKAIEVLKEMLENGWIETGTINVNHNNGRFQTLELSTEQTIEFIESEWNKLSDSPTLGDVCWFRATNKGRRLAMELGLAEPP
jgi:hypothetical protein